MNDISIWERSTWTEPLSHEPLSHEPLSHEPLSHEPLSHEALHCARATSRHCHMTCRCLPDSLKAKHLLLLLDAALHLT
jgi:hypothetical protein